MKLKYSKKKNKIKLNKYYSKTTPSPKKQIKNERKKLNKNLKTHESERWLVSCKPNMILLKLRNLSKKLL